MKFLAPAGLDDALAAKATHPDAVPIMGGTDVMVEMNFARGRPEQLLDLSRIAELSAWEPVDGRIRIGAAVSYARIIDELGTVLPGLAMAARTVGSPQIRHRGSVGGNLGAASPAGDSHPALLAAEAEVELASARGTRLVPAPEFYTGVKRHAGEPDELITAIWITPPSGPQQFCKVGTRNAMVIAVCAFGLALHPERSTIRTGIGSAAPTPIRALDAESQLTAAVADGGFWESRKPLPDSVIDDFGHRVADAASPIDDVRGTAAYRRHSLAVMARRSLRWAWDDYRRAG